MMLIVTKEGIVSNCSEKFIGFFGIEASAVNGKAIKDIPAIKPIARLLTPEGKRNSAIWVKDATTFLIKKALIDDLNIFYFLNITKLKKKKELLKKTLSWNRELELFINTCFDGFYVTDGKGITKWMSESSKKFYNIEEVNDFIGKPVSELEKLGKFMPSSTMRTLASNKKETVVQKSNTGKKILATATPINKKGFSRIVTISSDITNINNIEKRLEEAENVIRYYLKELSMLKPECMLDDEIVSRSKSFNNIMKIAATVAEVDSTVLIMGESGVGKQIVAKSIHKMSKRRESPFIEIDCGTIPAALLESELFGYEKGAFTGASIKGKKGKIESAQDGTLFLDEVGELPLDLQVKLLKFIQERQITRVGGLENISLNIRIITATNKDLDKLVRSGLFREDLYYRLNVIPITVPPLRERKEDIPSLLYHYLEKFNGQYGRHKKITLKAMDLLSEYSWPGNVRELINVIERAVVICENQYIDVEHLPVSIRPPVQLMNTARDYLLDEIISLKDATNNLEKAILKAAKERCQTTYEIATLLKVNQSTVVRKLKSYGL